MLLWNTQYLLICEVVADGLVQLFEFMAVANHSNLVGCWSCRAGPVETTDVGATGPVVALGEVLIEDLMVLVVEVVEGMGDVLRY